MNIKIKITGSGTKEEIAQALENLAKSIKATTDESFEKGIEYEDATLMTEAEEDIEEF